MTEAQVIVAETLRLVSEWGCGLTRDEYRTIAESVEQMDADDTCCPLCEEIICDDGCPLWPTRVQLDREGR